MHTVRWVAPGWLLVVFLASVAPAPVAAQGDPYRVLLRGRVIDADTRTPVEGAFVAPTGSNRGTLTDSLGVWALEVDPEATYRLTAEALGYAVLDALLNSTAPQEFTTILLRPNPIALAGLNVLVDRFERRRRFYFGSVRVMDQSVLLRSAQATVYDLVRSQVPFARPCVEDDRELCSTRRGRRQPVKLCIDEQPAWGGARELEAMDPRELYLLEVYGWGEQVRVYTRWYVEGMLRRGRRLSPLGFSC